MRGLIRAKVQKSPSLREVLAPMRPQFLSQPFSEMADCGIVDAWGPVLRGDLDSFALLHGPGRSSSIPVQTFQEKPTVALYTRNVGASTLPNNSTSNSNISRAKA